MLSKIKNLCEPETFAQLQLIFDAAWAEVEASGKIPSDEREAARTRLASTVMDQMPRSDLQDAAKLRKEVLAEFWSGQK